MCTCKTQKEEKLSAASTFSWLQIRSYYTQKIHLRRSDSKLILYGGKYFKCGRVYAASAPIKASHIFSGYARIEGAYVRGVGGCGSTCKNSA